MTVAFIRSGMHVILSLWGSFWIGIFVSGGMSGDQTENMFHIFWPIVFSAVILMKNQRAGGVFLATYGIAGPFLFGLSGGILYVPAILLGVGYILLPTPGGSNPA